MESIATRTCNQCGKTIRGRTDKKFCDDYCRNVFNNQLKADSNIIIRQTNSKLRKNRSILERIFPKGQRICKTTKERLLTEGFRFQYHTHTYTNKKGHTYHFCYDFGWLLTNDQICVIVKSV